MSVDAVDTSAEAEGGSRSAIARYYRPILAYGVLAVLLILYRSLSDQVFTLPVITATFNQGLALAVTAVAQTIVVLTAGIDLSVGSIVALANAVAATQMQPGVFPTLAVVVLTLAVGAAAGGLQRPADRLRAHAAHHRDPGHVGHLQRLRAVRAPQRGRLCT